MLGMPWNARELEHETAIARLFHDGKCVSYFRVRAHRAHSMLGDTIFTPFTAVTVQWKLCSDVDEFYFGFRRARSFPV